jgi:hypothetical protein
MHLIIVVEPDRELVDHRLRIGLGADAGIIALEGSDKSFGHAVALRAFDRCGSWDEADVSRETPGIVRCIAAAVVGQPFDGVRQLVDAPEAMLDGGDHEIADIAGRYAACCCDKPHGFPVAAIESEGDADPGSGPGQALFAVVAGDFETIGAPAAVAGVDRDLAVVPTFLAAPAVSLQQQTVELHDPVDPLGIRRRSLVSFGLTAEQRMDATIAVGRQIIDHRTNIGDEITVGERRSSPTADWSTVAHGGEMRSRDTDRVSHRAHRPPFGNEVERNKRFFGPAARETASRRISFSMVFLPSRR